jgi:hypothetical protein
MPAPSSQAFLLHLPSAQFHGHSEAWLIDTQVPLAGMVALLVQIPSTMASALPLATASGHLAAMASVATVLEQLAATDLAVMASGTTTTLLQLTAERVAADAEIAWVPLFPNESHKILINLQDEEGFVPLFLSARSCWPV